MFLVFYASCSFVEYIKRVNLKYWRKRFDLFSKFNLGVFLDPVGWYSVTPEKIAIHVAEKCACDVIVDAFCGCGGNAIQFAFTCERVIAIDNNPCRLAIAKHNATLYGVADRIDFILGDFILLAPTLRAEVVFLAPPWGGPSYNDKEKYNLEDCNTRQLYQLSSIVTPNIAFCLPKNLDLEQLQEIADGKYFEVEENMSHGVHEFTSVYFGTMNSL